uniref:Tryptophan 2-monooxygenase n=2 Tax=Candidatus Kentrum sp. LPFa TaxID=2126335 RepID=A0A450Y0J1_9GAMM|nr:MAG: monoamine oxidase [Candidatus Kentron sp. LPFa]
MSHRIGGRLESVCLPGMEISGELGGMRYMTSQKIITTLIKNVFASELTSVDFPTGNNKNHFGYFRKQRFRLNAWRDAQKNGQKLETRYYLNEDDKGFSANQLFNKVVYSVLKHDSRFMEQYGSRISHPSEYEYIFHLTRKDWDHVKPKIVYNFKGAYNGEKVNDIGFWNLIKDQVSEEGYTFLANAGGYYSNTINWNSAEAFPYMVEDFSDDKMKYKTIEGGYDKIAYALADTYLRKHGAAIWGGNRLLTFHESKDTGYRYELVFFNEDEKREYSILANRIILGMPKRSLKLLNQYNFFFYRNTRKVFQRNIDSVITEPSFKILMGFEEPWWEKDFGTKAGRSITDLPMRQCYYFGTNPDDSHSLFLGSYNDMRSAIFWSVLDHEPLYEPKETRLVSSANLKGLKPIQAPKRMVDEVMNQIREVHGRQDIPQPYVTWPKDWTRDPYGGGYHAWRAGYDVPEVMKYMRKPYPDEDIFICGDAYSNQQGWVEGAFCVTENMLQEHFGLKWPEWLDKSYYLGW